jgi:membrane associated rhomboid family serine protease
MGAYLYLYPKAAMYQAIIIPYPFKIPVPFYLCFWVVIQFLGTYTQSNVAWWAHLGGFIAGLIITFLWYKITSGFSRRELSL